MNRMDKKEKSAEGDEIMRKIKIDLWSTYYVPGMVVNAFQSHESGTIKYPFYR